MEKRSHMKMSQCVRKIGTDEPLPHTHSPLHFISILFVFRAFFRAARVRHFVFRASRVKHFRRQGRRSLPRRRAATARGPSAGPQRQPAGFLSLAEACGRQHLGPGRRGAIQGVQARSWQASQGGSQRPLRRNGNNAGRRPAQPRPAATEAAPSPWHGLGRAATPSPRRSTCHQPRRRRQRGGTAAQQAAPGKLSPAYAGPPAPAPPRLLWRCGPWAGRPSRSGSRTWCRWRIAC